MASTPDRITCGVDTHLDVHVAAALNEPGALLGTNVFPADARSYRQLLNLLASLGTAELIGVEGRVPMAPGLPDILHANNIAGGRG